MTTLHVGTPVQTPSKALVAFAWGVLAFMVLVVLWGAVVRATSSGAGCGENWPLCNGDFFPHHPRLATVIEFTHRSMSGICTFLVAALTTWTFYGTSRGHRARRSVLWSVGLLITEALFGAALVLKHYVENNISTGRVVMQSVHLTNTMLLLAALTITAWFLGQSRRAQDFGLRTAGLKGVALLAVVATLVVAATGSLAALADTLFPAVSLRAGLEEDFAASSPLLVRMRWIHPVASVVGFFCVLWLAKRMRSKLSALVLGLFVAQVALGVVDILLLAPIWMQVVHLFGADIYWAALVVLAAEVWWPLRRTSTA